MTIEEYLVSNGSYTAGLALYAASPYHSGNVLRALQRSQNKGTLFYELTKIAKKDKTPKLAKEPLPVAEPTPKQKRATTQKQLIEQSVNAKYPKVIFARLPKPLQSRFIEQKTAFYKSCQLKMALNELAPDDDAAALDLIQEIIKLRDFVDTVWKEIDYYTDNGRIMPVAPQPYTDLKGMEVFTTRQLLYQRKTKRKKTITKLQDRIAQEKDVKRKKTLQNRLFKKEEEYHQIVLDINHLTAKING